MSPRRGFASDNQAGVHPEVMAAIAAANTGHAPSYGDDEWTARVEERFREHFGPNARTYLVFNGTAANVLCLETLTQPWEGVICADSAHMHTDEGGAPERAGRKLLVVDTPDGRLTPEAIEPLIVRIGDEHAVQPRVISITQTTERGTRYTPDDVAALAAFAHERGMFLHVDGARLANAAAALNTSLRALTTDAGVDAVSFGGTKNGLLAGEAVVLLREGIGNESFKYRRKQAMQLASKMRFIAAQFDALLSGDLWLRSAAHANAMAQRLAAALAGARVRITQPVEANAVFAILEPAIREQLERRFPFYVWDERTGEVRWMTAWDTQPEDVDAFAAAIVAAHT